MKRLLTLCGIMQSNLTPCFVIVVVCSLYSLIMFAILCGTAIAFISLMVLGTFYSGLLAKGRSVSDGAYSLDMGLHNCCACLVGIMVQLLLVALHLSWFSYQPLVELQNKLWYMVQAFSVGWVLIRMCGMYRLISHTHSCSFLKGTYV